MGKVCFTLTVFFEDPFWVGVFEYVNGRHLSVSKVTFGAEPRDCELLEFVSKHCQELRFSPAVTAVAEKTVRNPKRLQREARKQTSAAGVGTKAQQAIKLQQEQNKLERKAVTREMREAAKARLFELKQQKKNEKHRGH